MPNPVKPSLRTEWRSWLILAAAGVLAVYFYQNFPARVPTHWNIQGDPDGYSSASFAASFVPGLMVVIYLFFLLLPYFDPRRERYSEFASAYHIVKDLILAFMLVLFLITGLAALGYPVDISFWVPVMVGALFIVLGFLMARVKTNWFIGIRTPWTLSSEAVWAKTHRAAPLVMGIAGLLMAATVLVTSPAAKVTLFILSIASVAIGLPVYSYLVFRQEQNAGK